MIEGGAETRLEAEQDSGSRAPCNGNQPPGNRQPGQEVLSGKVLGCGGRGKES